MARFAICAVLLALPLAAQAQSAGQWKSPSEMYKSVCGYCHDVGVGPPIEGSGLPADQLIETVRRGHGPMPAFKPSEFSDADLKQLAGWLAKPVESK